jgi:hypothetical protein
MNCRVIVIDQNTKAVLDQIGPPGDCTRDPPNGVGSPNGDTPLSDGNLLASEINGSWVDEYNDRMVAIDPQTGALVWHHGETGVPGTTAGHLNTPNGFDILGPAGSTPTHPATG